jgi:hypothetical protein
VDTAVQGTVRTLRAAVATLVVLGLSALAHELGGGGPPGPAALGVLAVLLGPPIWLAVGRALGPSLLVALLGGAQALVHLALRAMAPASGSGRRVHVHDSLPAGLQPAPPMPGMGGPPHLDTRMLLAHVVGTLVLAALLLLADEALGRLLEGLAPRGPVPPRWPGLARVLVLRTPTGLVGRAPRPFGGRAPPPALS